MAAQGTDRSGVNIYSMQDIISWPQEYDVASREIDAGEVSGWRVPSRESLHSAGARFVRGQIRGIRKKTKRADLHGEDANADPFVVCGNSVTQDSITPTDKSGQKHPPSRFDIRIERDEEGHSERLKRQTWRNTKKNHSLDSRRRGHIVSGPLIQFFCASGAFSPIFIIHTLRNPWSTCRPLLRKTTTNIHPCMIHNNLNRSYGGSTTLTASAPQSIGSSAH